MVAGEDYIVGKAAESLISWFNKRKYEKEIVHEILISLKMGLNSIPLHMNLSKEDGYINYNKFEFYLPGDIEYLNQTLIKYQSKVDNDLYDGMMGFINILVDYNEKINSLCMDMGDVDDKERIVLETVDELVKKIDDLIKKVE